MVNAAFADILTLYEGGARLTVRARPGQSRPRAPKIVDVGDGKRAVEIAVAAAAEGGKANKALMEALATALQLKKADLAIKAGTTGRRKVVEMRGDPAALGRILVAWLTQL